MLARLEEVLQKSLESKVGCLGPCHATLIQRAKPFSELAFRPRALRRNLASGVSGGRQSS